jgi:LPS-assembly protein
LQFPVRTPKARRPARREIASLRAVSAAVLLLVTGQAALGQAAVQPAAAAAPPAATPSAASSPASAPTPNTASGPADGIALKPSPSLSAPPRGPVGKQLPIVLRADVVTGSLEQQANAEGDAEFRRGGMVIKSDRLMYDSPTDTARAAGDVRVSRDGNVYSGPQVELQVERFEGYFDNPTYRFAKTGAGGTASRIDFYGQQRSMATDATYSSCPADGPPGPAWILTTRPTRAWPRTRCCGSTTCRSSPCPG